MTGYLSKRAQNQSDNDRPHGWRDYLDNYYRTSFVNGDYLAGFERLAIIQTEMQARFPGKYQVVSFYNTKKMRFDMRLSFDDPKQETMWKIKHSQ